MKTELWNSHKIRFVELEDEWWAVAKDVAGALAYRDAHEMLNLVDTAEKSRAVVNMGSDPDKTSTSDETGISSPNRKVLIVSELGIYEAIFSSQKPEAKEFKAWVKDVLEKLRQATGLEGFQIFRMADKQHQKQAMQLLHDNLPTPTKIDYIKANAIANKAVSTAFGYPRLVKKHDMTPDMLAHRQAVLADTVELMTANEKYGLGLSVSRMIYQRVGVGIRA